MLVFSRDGQAQDELLLPSGLQEGSPSPKEEPSLPEGLEGMGLDNEPILPEGLGLPRGEVAPATQEPEGIGLVLGFSGFWEGRFGLRTQKDSHEKDVSIGETRVQFQISLEWESATFQFTSDHPWNQNTPFPDSQFPCIQLHEYWPHIPTKPGM